MKFNAPVAISLVLAAVSVPLPSLHPTLSADGYSHGKVSCLQGNDGTGIRLQLSEHRQCEGQALHSYLEIDVRELPITVDKSIAIGDTSSAFRCNQPNTKCEQFQSGQIMFNHFEETSAKGIQTDGWYELSPTTGLPETGRFKVDCIAPCA
jgi:hypothetical protein